MSTCKGFPQITQIILSIVSALQHHYAEGWQRHGAPVWQTLGEQIWMRSSDWSTQSPWLKYTHNHARKCLPHEHFIQSVSEAGLQREYNWSKEKKAFSLHLAIFVPIAPAPSEGERKSFSELAIYKFWPGAAAESNPTALCFLSVFKGIVPHRHLFLTLLLFQTCMKCYCCTHFSFPCNYN